MKAVGWLLLAALVGCGDAAREPVSGDYDVRIGSLDTATCLGSMQLTEGAGSWSCGQYGGEADLDTSRPDVTFLTLETIPSSYVQIQTVSKSPTITGPVVWGDETLIFAAFPR